MLTTVTLNAAVDTTYSVDHFTLDQVNRVGTKQALPGGKGINVARVANTLGTKVQATGFVAGQTGKFIQHELVREGIANNFLEVDGESRICLAIIDAIANTQTELLESGPELCDEIFTNFLQHLKAITVESPLVACSGSLPGGLPEDSYARIIQEFPDKKVILDTSGAALAQGLKAAPFMVKPNEHELAALLGTEIKELEQVLAAGEKILEQGVEIVVISLGEKGAVALKKGERYLATPPSLTPVSTVGCGDSLVAGMATAILQEKDLTEALRLGSACGAANALVPGAGQARLDDIERILPQVKIQSL